MKEIYLVLPLWSLSLTDLIRVLKYCSQYYTTFVFIHYYLPYDPFSKQNKIIILSGPWIRTFGKVIAQQ